MIYEEFFHPVQVQITEGAVFHSATGSEDPIRAETFQHRAAGGSMPKA